jgi:hypothetical protein
MAQKSLSSLLNLNYNATPTQISVVIIDLMAKAQRVDKAEKELSDFYRIEVEKILKKGRDEKKLTSDLSDKLSKTYATNPKGLADLISSIKPQITPRKYQGKTFNDLYKSGELEHVKNNFPVFYETIKNKR